TYEGRRVRPAAQATPHKQEHAEELHGAADQLVLIEQAESAEQVGPIVLAAAHERQLLGARVFDVDGDVPEVLRDPPQRDGRRVAVAAAPEIPHEERRDQELHQRAAEHPDELAEHAEQRVPDLVDRDVEAVEPAVALGVEREHDPIHRQERGQGEAQAALYEFLYANTSSATSTRPNGALTCTPCTAPFTCRNISRAIATPSPITQRVGGPIGLLPGSSPWFRRYTRFVNPMESMSNTAVASG